MLSNPKGLEEIRLVLFDLYAQVRDECVVDWVEENIELPTGAITGKVQMKYIPYGREILERFGDKKTRHLVLVFPTQAAKALSLDTPIATPSGWTTVRALREGDIIFGGDGRPCRVLSKTAVFTDRECYRVTFGGGDSIVADAGHLWKAERRYDKRSRGQSGKWDIKKSEWRTEVVETSELRTGVAYPHRIPTAGAIQAPRSELPIQPYTLGVWLGDGSSGGARFWSDKRDAIEIMHGIRMDGYPIGIIREQGNARRISVQYLQSALRGTGLINNKHIHGLYLRASEDQRMELLRGLMDTDGTCTSRGEASFTTTKPKLRDGTRELIASLGFKPRVSEGRARVNGKDCGPCWKIKFHADGRRIFKLARKQAKVIARKRDHFRGHEIRSVERVPTVPVQCISVDSSDHTFLVGRDMIPTHNSTLLICGMLYRLCRDPEDAMWVFGNADQARDFSKERWQLFCYLCKAANDLIPKTAKGGVNKHLWGFTAQHFLSMVLNFVGAGSTTNLSSRPRGLILMDEVDKYYDELKFDAGTIQLAEERQKTFHFPLSVKASSPTLKDRMIWVEFLKTDQRHYWLPCPRCEQEILFRLKVVSPKHGDCGLRWWHEHESEAKTDGHWDMKKVRANAFYKSQCCGGMIHSFERPMMLEAGIWKPANPVAAAGRHGYHLNSLYSILSQQTSFGSIADQFLTAKGLRSELQNFINGWMAEPWDESQAYDMKDVKIELFTNQNIAEEGSFTLMGVDVQENGFWVVIRRFAPPTETHPHGQSWLLYADWVGSEADLVDLQKEYAVLGEDVVLDMAHRPNQVGKLIIENDWRGVWGSPNTKHFYHKQPDGTRISRPYSVVQFRDPMLGTAWENRTFKRARYVNFAKDAILDLVSSLRYAEPTIWHVSVNVNTQYSRHLNSRVKRQERSKRTGRVEYIWHELHQQNHLADAESFVTVRALQRGLLSPPNETEEQNVMH